MTKREVFFALIRNEITGAPLDLDGDLKIDEVAFLRFAKKHDVAHLISDALIKNGIVTSDNKKYGKILREKKVAVYRVEQINGLICEIKKLFQENEIYFICLKGAVIRSLYPEPWMRTSCDFDVLIKKEDVDRAVNILLENGFTTENEKTSYDLSLYYGKTHLELHHSLCRNDKTINEILEKVWDHSVQKEGYEFSMTKEFYVFNHITHMISHFFDGGCGIRPFIDLWLMRKNDYYDEKGLIAILEKCGLAVFYKRICELSDVWIENKEHNEATRLLEKYILRGGVYGSEENAHEIGVAKNGKSRIKYVWNLAFPDYKFMCYVYPILKKHIILLPFCYIHRFFSKLFGKERKRIRNRVKNINKSSDERIKEASLLIKELGLDNTRDQLFKAAKTD